MPDPDIGLARMQPSIHAQCDAASLLAHVRLFAGMGGDRNMGTLQRNFWLRHRLGGPEHLRFRER